MIYGRDINRIVKEKDRLRKIKSRIGISLVDVDRHDTVEAVMAESLIQDAIEKLHEAEMVLRRREV